MISKTFIAMLKFYRRWISPQLGNHCRFHPTCSGYAIEAIQDHGLLRGGVYALWRILRCNPWCAGGVDPVPPVKSEPRYG